MSRRFVISGLTVLLIGALAGPAWAKGPEGATIVGPGIADPIVIEGSGEYSNGTTFSQFVEAAGFWNLVFGADSAGSRFGRMTTAPTSADLGPLYVVTWHLLENRIRADVYPLAEGGPLVHLDSGSTIIDFDTETAGGWFAAQPILLDLMENYGVQMGAESDITSPAEPEVISTPARSFPALPATVILTVLVIGAGAWWATRRRPRRVSVP